MKKRLLGLGLILTMVFAFAFTACDNGYTPPDFGEKGYAEYCYEGLHYNNDQAPTEALITSKKALKKFLRTVKFAEGVFWDDDYTGSRETVYTRLMDQFDSYSSRYFKDNALVAVIKTASSGSYSYTVKSAEAQNHTLNVALQCWKPGDGVTADIKTWCILIELPKGDYKQLKVEEENKFQTREVAGTGFYMLFTHEASLDTLYHDYTPEDFPELDFDFTIEEYLIRSRDEVREALSNGATSGQFSHFARMFKIVLTEKSKENVLRAMERLGAREEIEAIEPNYEYFWPEE